MEDNTVDSLGSLIGVLDSIDNDILLDRLWVLGSVCTVGQWLHSYPGEMIPEGGLLFDPMAIMLQGFKGALSCPPCFNIHLKQLSEID